MGSAVTGEGRAGWRAWLERGFWGACALYLVLFGLVSLTRTRDFSPDSMNYVDVGRNIAAGRGIVQSTLGYNQPRFPAEDAEAPTPLVSQPPLYPLSIASLTALGMQPADAGLLIPVLAYGAVLLLAYRIARRLYGPEAGLFAVACLMLYRPLQAVASVAWSEALGTAFVLGCFWLLLRAADQTYPVTALAGVLAGLAFITRYANLLAFVIGFLPLIARCDRLEAPGVDLDRTPDARLQPGSLQSLSTRSPAVASSSNIPQVLGGRSRSFGRVALYAGGFAVVAAPVVVRNLVLSGMVLGPAANPSTIALRDNLWDAWWALAGDYLGVGNVSPEGQALLAACLLLAGAGLLLRRRLSSAAQGVLAGRGSQVLIAWSAIYLIALIYQRTRLHFDAIDARLIMPAGVTLVLLLAGLLAKSLGRMGAALTGAALALALVLAGKEAAALVVSPPYEAQRVIAASERLSWVAQATTDRDLIIGDDTVDLPFYLPRTAAVSFSPYPYTDRPEYDKLASFIRHRCDRYDHVYLLLRRRSGQVERFRQQFGSFIADLVAGKTESYPGIVLLQRLADGTVFEVHCPQLLTAAPLAP